MNIASEFSIGSFELEFDLTMASNSISGSLKLRHIVVLFKTMKINVPFYIGHSSKIYCDCSLLCIAYNQICACSTSSCNMCHYLSIVSENEVNQSELQTNFCYFHLTHAIRCILYCMFMLGSVCFFSLHKCFSLFLLLLVRCQATLSLICQYFHKFSPNHAPILVSAYLCFLYVYILCIY